MGTPNLPVTNRTLEVLGEINDTELSDLSERIRTGSASFAARAFEILAAVSKVAPVIESALKARLEADPTPLPLSGGKSLVLTTQERRSVEDMDALLAAVRTQLVADAPKLIVTKETVTIAALEKVLKDRAPGFFAGLPDGTIKSGTSRSLKVIG